MTHSPTHNSMAGHSSERSKPSVGYTAHDLDDIADFFDTLAGDQLACVRFQTTVKAKRACEIRAGVWKEAAALLRETRLVGDGE